MHFLYQNGQMGVVLEIFVNGYPTWLKTPLCTVVQECILAGTNAIYDFSCFVIKTIISRYFGILRICEFHLPLNQTLFYTCTDVPNLTYHDFCKIHIKF